MAELESRLSARTSEAAGYAEKSWFLRAHYAAWQRFIEKYPTWKVRWEAFLAADELDPFADVALTDPGAKAG